jgi:beta-lactam-binding protein with PASTA domain
VPDVRGLPTAQAQQRLQQAGFTNISVGSRTPPSDDVQEEVVVASDPAQGTQAAADTPIRLSVAFNPNNGGDGNG